MYYLPTTDRSQNWAKSAAAKPTMKTSAQCVEYLKVMEVGAEDQKISCEPVQTFLNGKIFPANTLKTKDLIDEWWHVLSCGRVLLSFNAQCVEELNKIEEQAKFVRVAEVHLTPKVREFSSRLCPQILPPYSQL